MSRTNKELPRKYMEVIRDVSQTKGNLYLQSIRAKHHSSQLGGIMRKLGWIKGTGPWSKWIGPMPRTEEELLRMANIFIAELRTKNALRNNPTYSGHRIPTPSVGVNGHAQPPIVHQAMQPAPSPAPFEVSILWGLFTFKA